MKEAEALQAFSALSGETRLRMLRLLVVAGEGGMTAGDISAQTAAAPSRASFHLSALTKAGLVSATREAKQIRYHVRFETLGELMGYILTDCCQNHPTVRSCCLGDQGC